MLTCHRFGSQKHLVRRLLRARPSVELLESRHLPSSSGLFAAAPLVLGATPSSQDAPENLGTFTPANLNGGVTVLGSFVGQTADYYQFQVVETKESILLLDNVPTTGGMPAGNWLSLTNVTTGESEPLDNVGNTNGFASQVGGQGQALVLARLDPGNVYVLQVTAWSAVGVYSLEIAYPDRQPENPVPLPIGSAAAVRLQLLNPGVSTPAAPTPLTTAPPPITLTTAPGNPTLPTLVPVVGGSTGIVLTSVPVITGNPAEPAAGSSIPSSVYVALGAGSVGGTNIGNLNTPRDLYDRLYGQEPALALNDRVVGLAILSQVGTTAGASPVVASVTDLQSWWQNLLRRFGQTAPLGSSETAESVLKADASPEEEEEVMLLGPQEVRAPRRAERREEQDVAQAPGMTCRGELRPEAALAISVLFAALAARQRRQRQPALTARRIHGPHEFTA